MSDHSGQWLARIAAGVVSQLPESTVEALQVLQLARRIILATDRSGASCVQRRCSLRVIRFGETARE